ncbi:hypothetical protein OHT77_00380 [Streptomyces sp. NBC_00252]|uniref:hypothetical protein n=1 Tax=Streptomyces sp. NBC_00252 TaxID=2975691 RepID=UPI002E2E0063|nr:hypothetical protein [Streptomyces sp. NBC_00252]
MTTALDGFLDLAGPGEAWCVTGVRLEPDPTLARGSGALGLPAEEHRRRAVQLERAWLTEAWAPDGRCWELRYGPSGRGDGRLGCVLLARAAGPTPLAARAGAHLLREQLGRLPGSVRRIPLDAGQLMGALRPWKPVGMVEIRPRVHWSAIPRKDAAFPYGLYVDALTAEPVAWEPLWTELTRIDGRFSLGVRLEPLVWRQQDTAMVERLLVEYTALGRPGRFNPATGWQEGAVPFAEEAAVRYARLRQAVDNGHAYRLRTALACADPAALASVAQAAQVLAAAVGGGGGAGAAVVRSVRDPGEHHAAWRAFAHLHDEWLPEVRQQDFPYGLGDFERMLVDRVSVAEASAAFRLPAETGGHLPMFSVFSADPQGGTPARPAGPPPSTAAGLPLPPPGFGGPPEPWQGRTP